MKMNAAVSRRALLAALSGVAIAAGAGYASAQSDDFYAGQTVRIVVGAGAGGGYDTYSRAIANHLPKHIPGSPTVVVENMPGAGSTRAAEHIATSAPNDGTVIGAVFPGAIVGPLFDEQMEVRYEPTEFAYIGTADSGTRVCVTYEAADASTFEDARQREVIIGASQEGGSTRDYPVFLNNLAETRFNIISGYEGTREITLAMERGEVDGICGWDWSSLQSQRSDWVEAGQLNFLVQIALEPEPGLTAMGVPEVWEFIDEDEREAVELIVSQQVFQRPYIAPPGTPEEQVEVLRQAFMAVMEDPEFLAEAERAGLSITPLSGERVAALVERMYGASEEVVQQAREAMEPAS
jgi:tripartite-type tricarboxylate transporter receptor subunit TctC